MLKNEDQTKTSPNKNGHLSKNTVLWVIDKKQQQIFMKHENNDANTKQN